MTNINNLFQTALEHISTTSSISWENLLILIGIAAVCYGILAFVWTMTNLDCSEFGIMHERLAQCGLIIISVIAALVIGRHYDLVNHNLMPVQENYQITEPSKVKQNITKISKDYPFVLKITSNDIFNNEHTQTEYFVFSDSAAKIQKLNNQLNDSDGDNLVFLTPSKSLIIVKAEFDTNTMMLKNYKVLNQSVGLKSGKWDVNFHNTSQLKLNDFKLTDDN